jgi:hypothetical protein
MTTKTLTNVEIKDATKGLVTAVVSTFGVVDLDGDVTSKSSFTAGAPVVVSGYGHTSWDGQLPIGKGVLSTSNTEAIAELAFFMDTPHGAAAFNTIKELGPLQEWSYSLEDTVRKAGELDGTPCMFIESTVVKEVSPVLRGASIGTRTLSVKAADLTFSEHAASVVADVAVLVARASEVVALRAEKGKTISDSSLELLRRLDTELLALKALIDEPTPPVADDDQSTREYLRFVAASLQGAT